ncbi:GDSL esterase/lipase [Morus notabilis]|uniref:GDSL esterase/lipase n=1 Tax=Morus notabilis TaxID=981085 RepID=W9RB61_9ROSA|nr:GDSL esterase/lipase At5g55050 [Morus notabilis]EXB66343.1 GDSL esterase/lipase [Morus notabilis]
MAYYNNNINVMPKGFFLILIIFLLDYEAIISFSEAQQVPAIYVFGDSLVDVGNNNYLKLSLAKANYPPNGVDFPGRKATGRFCNGKNAADFLAEKVGLATSPPYLSRTSNSNKDTSTGISFASGGAGIFNGTDEFYRQSIPLTKQVEHYSKVHEQLVQELGIGGTEVHLSKSLFAIVIGSNDLFGYFGSSELRKKVTPEQYVDKMVVTLQEQLKRLHSYGARKLVAVGVGPIGCCPAERKKDIRGGCLEEVNQWVIKYNDGLKSTLTRLKSELKNLNYAYFETYDVLLNLIQKPESYGFVEVKAACCGLGKLKADAPCLPLSAYCSNRADHIFWDKYHPSEATDSILVNYLFDGPSEYTFPLNVKQLIAL